MIAGELVRASKIDSIAIQSSYVDQAVIDQNQGAEMVQGKGGWVSYKDEAHGMIDGGEIGFHSSELGALRRAVSINGSAVHVEYGQTLGEAIMGVPAAARMPGEEPLPLNA